MRYSNFELFKRREKSGVNFMKKRQENFQHMDAAQETTR